MKYFSIKELYRSETADRLKINNRPSKEIENNIVLFIETVLDPIREDWGRAIMVSSGYRCDRLNKAVGGAENSGHKYGFCADLQIVGDIRVFADFVYNWMVEHKMAWDEIIFEKSGTKIWLHFCWIGKGGRQRMKRFDIVK